MAYAIIDDATGAWVSGPHEDDAGIKPAKGEVALDVPGSFLAGKTVWHAEKRGFVEPPPVYPTAAALAALTAPELTALLDFLGAQKVLSAARVAELKLV